MLHLSPSIAWLIFAQLTVAGYATVFLLCPSVRRAQVTMMLCGVPGGLVAALVYGTDFWQPSHALTGIPIEELLFGGGFLGIVTALALSGTEFIAPEQPRTVPRRRKVYLLSVMILGWFVLWGMGTNSVVATIPMLSAGAIFLAGQRPDLTTLIRRGALVSVAAFMVLVGVFVLIVDNADELGRAFSPFYAKHGPVWTSLVLGLWSASFGAFFGPFYLWWKNLRFF